MSTGAYHCATGHESYHSTFVALAFSEPVYLEANTIYIGGMPYAFMCSGGEIHYFLALWGVKLVRDYLSNNQQKV